MAIERRLIELIGAVGGKLHTARSRNDQVALDLRLYRARRRSTPSPPTSARCSARSAAGARRHADAIMPGYTHLQRAQPVLLAHHLLAYVEMLERDARPASPTAARAPTCCRSAPARWPARPSRSTARCVARELGFARVERQQPRRGRATATSSSSSSPRPAILGDAPVAASPRRSCSGRRSEFGFVELPDAFATGSSMMPQKKNPDVAELMRGKTGRVYGDLVGAADHAQGPAAGLQPRPAGGQAAALRHASTRCSASARGARPRMLPRAARARRPHARGRRAPASRSRPSSPTTWPARACRSATRTASSAPSSSPPSPRADSWRSSASPSCARSRPAFGRDVKRWLTPRRGREAPQGSGGTSPANVERRLKTLGVCELTTVARLTRMRPRPGRVKSAQSRGRPESLASRPARRCRLRPQDAGPAARVRRAGAPITDLTASNDRRRHRAHLEPPTPDGGRADAQRPRRLRRRARPARPAVRLRHPRSRFPTATACAS